MTSAAAPALRARGIRRPLERWCSRTAAELGSVPADWHDDVCPALITALHTGDDVAAVLHRFVRRRVRDGWGLRVIMDDLERLRRSLPPRRRWTSRWRTWRVEAAAAYADELIEDLLVTSGRDPLSGLPNHSYLAIHLEELVDATAADDDIRTQLLVVTAPSPRRSLPDRMAMRVLVGDALRETVPPGVLVAQAREERFVLVLPPLIPASAVRSSISETFRHLSGADAVVITTTALPRTRAELASLLGSWWGQPPLAHP